MTSPYLAPVSETSTVSMATKQQCKHCIGAEDVKMYLSSSHKRQPENENNITNSTAGT